MRAKGDLSTGVHTHVRVYAIPHPIGSSSDGSGWKIGEVAEAGNGEACLCVFIEF